MLDSNYCLLIIGDCQFQDELSDFWLVNAQDETEALKYQSEPFRFDLILDCSRNYRLDFSSGPVPIPPGNLKTEVYKVLNTVVKEADLNLNLALSMLDHNPRVYYAMLRRYIQTYENTDTLLQELIDQKEYLKIRELVHKIKGISLNLGSDKLYQISKYLEEKLVFGTVEIEDLELFRRYHQRILEYCKEQEKNV